jgi:hypothetical protein
MTLPEVMATTAIVAIVTMVAASVLSFSATQAHSVDLASQALADKTLFRLELQRAIENSIAGKVWMNAQAANALFIPFTVNDPTITDPVGALGVVPNTVIDANGVASADASGNFDVFVFIQKSPKAVPLTLDNSSASDPGYVIDGSQTWQKFNIAVAGSADLFSLASLVAVDSLSGTQFATLTARDSTSITLNWGNLGNFYIGNSWQNWPNLYLTSGVSVFPVQVEVLAANPSHTSISLWRIDSTTGKFNLIDSLAYTPVSLKATDMTNQGKLDNFLQLHQTPYEIFITLSVQTSMMLQILKIEQPL